MPIHNVSLLSRQVQLGTAYLFFTGLLPFPGHSMNNAAGIAHVPMGRPPVTECSTSLVKVSIKVQDAWKGDRGLFMSSIILG